MQWIPKQIVTICEDFHSQVGDGKVRTTLYKVRWEGYDNLERGVHLAELERGVHLADAPQDNIVLSRHETLLLSLQKKRITCP
jgi:hypothetical protein